MFKKQQPKIETVAEVHTIDAALRFIINQTANGLLSDDHSVMLGPSTFRDLFERVIKLENKRVIKPKTKGKKT